MELTVEEKEYHHKNTEYLVRIFNNNILDNQAVLNLVSYALKDVGSEGYAYFDFPYHTIIDDINDKLRDNQDEWNSIDTKIYQQLEKSKPINGISYIIYEYYHSNNKFCITNINASSEIDLVEKQDFLTFFIVMYVCAYLKGVRYKDNNLYFDEVVSAKNNTKQPLQYMGFFHKKYEQQGIDISNLIFTLQSIDYTPNLENVVTDAFLYSKITSSIDSVLTKKLIQEKDKETFEKQKLELFLEHSKAHKHVIKNIRYDTATQLLENTLTSVEQKEAYSIAKKKDKLRAITLDFLYTPFGEEHKTLLVRQYKITTISGIIQLLEDCHSTDQRKPIVEIESSVKANLHNTIPMPQLKSAFLVLFNTWTNAQIHAEEPSFKINLCATDTQLSVIYSNKGMLFQGWIDYLNNKTQKPPEDKSDGLIDIKKYAGEQNLNWKLKVEAANGYVHFSFTIQ